MAAIIPIPAFRDNYIWALRKGAAVAVVDPGDALPVLDYLRAESATLTAILATHHHADHVGGIAELVEHFGAPVFGPASETIPGRTHPLGEGDRVLVPGLDVRLEVLDVPGHTAGHIAYVGEVDGVHVAFCGDTLFAGGCGRVFEGTPAQMWASLSKLAALPAATRIYCAHEYTLANLRFAAAVEPANAAVEVRRKRDEAARERGLPTVPSTLADEHATNPFLRAAVPAVAAAAAAHAGGKLQGVVATFAALREWKNGF